MSISFRLVRILICAGLCVSLAGCPSADKPVVAPAGGEAAHEHDHDHAHTGPHGGHIIEIGAEEYHAEWTHDKSGKVTVYFLDSAMKNEVAPDGDTVKIATKVGDKTAEYTLESDKPMGSTFTTTDPALLGSLEALGDAVTATLHAKLGGKDFTAPITKGGHDHNHDHGHEH